MTDSSSAADPNDDDMVMLASITSLGLQTSSPPPQAVSESLSKELSVDSADFDDVDPPEYASLLDPDEREGDGSADASDIDFHEPTRSAETGDSSLLETGSDLAQSEGGPHSGGAGGEADESVSGGTRSQEGEPASMRRESEEAVRGQDQAVESTGNPKEEVEASGAGGSFAGLVPRSRHTRLRDTAARTVLAVTKLQARLRSKQERQAVLAMRREEELRLQLEEQAFAAKRAQLAMEAILDQERGEKEQILLEKDAVEREVVRLKAELKAAKRRELMVLKELESLRRRMKIHDEKARALEAQFRGRLETAERLAQTRAADKAKAEALKRQKRLQEEHEKQTREMLGHIRAQQSELKRQQLLITKQEKKLQALDSASIVQTPEPGARSQQVRKKAVSPARIRMRLVKKSPPKSRSRGDDIAVRSATDSDWQAFGKMSTSPPRNEAPSVTQSWSPNPKSKRRKDGRIGLRLHPRSKASPRPSGAMEGRRGFAEFPRRVSEYVPAADSDSGPSPPGPQQLSEHHKKENAVASGRIGAVLEEAVSVLNRVSSQLSQIDQAKTPPSKSGFGWAPAVRDPAEAGSADDAAVHGALDEEFQEWRQRLRTKLDVAEGAAFAVVLATGHAAEWGGRAA